MAPALIHDPSAAYARAVRLRVRTPSTSVPCVVDINHRAIRQGAPFVEISSDTLGISAVISRTLTYTFPFPLPLPLVTIPDACVDPRGGWSESLKSMIGWKTSDCGELADSIYAASGSRSTTAFDIAVAFGPLNHGKSGSS